METYSPLVNLGIYSQFVSGFIIACRTYLNSPKIMTMLKIYFVTELKSRRSLQVKEIAVTGLSIVKVMKVRSVSRVFVAGHPILMETYK